MKKQPETKAYSQAYRVAFERMMDDWSHPDTTEKNPIFVSSRKGKIPDES